MMVDADVCSNPYLTFGCVCRAVGAVPDELNEILLHEVGMKGEEIIVYLQAMHNAQ